MNTSVRGIQGCGKTASMVAADLEHLTWDGYKPDELYVNYKINVPGAHCLNNVQMIQFIKDTVKQGLKHKLINITEADRVFPARFWQDKQQTEALIGLWQDEKLFNLIYWDAHFGTGVDVVMRNIRQIAWIPKYYKALDLIVVHVINGLYGREYDLKIPDVSKNVFPFYNRWEVIKDGK